VNNLVEDLKGKQYGDWTLVGIRKLVGKFSHASVLARCKCGFEKWVWETTLKSGQSRACLKCAGQKRAKHGVSNVPKSQRIHSYKAWLSMRDRVRRLPRYQALGCCERWNEYLNFVADMGEPSDPKLTLERIYNEKGYSPENCKWANRSEQNQNLRTTIRYTFNGKTMTLKGWSLELGCSMARLWQRIVILKMPLEEALNRAMHKRGPKGVSKCSV
jgi:hypothetical protein